jgi:hypothetical protein
MSIAVDIVAAFRRQFVVLPGDHTISVRDFRRIFKGRFTHASGRAIHIDHAAGEAAADVAQPH